MENRLHGGMDVAFADDQMRARTGHAAHNLAVLEHMTLNLIRLDPLKRKDGIKRRAASKPADSAPPPLTPPALSFSVWHDVHAIALGVRTRIQAVFFR